MYRSDSYDKKLSQKLRDLEFAQEYILSLVEDKDESMSVESALHFVIQRMGTTDFANLVGEDKGNVDKFLKGKRILKEDTLNRYLEPFGLRIKKTLEKVA